MLKEHLTYVVDQLRKSPPETWQRVAGGFICVNPEFIRAVPKIRHQEWQDFAGVYRKFSTVHVSGKFEEILVGGGYMEVPGLSASYVRRRYETFYTPGYSQDRVDYSLHLFRAPQIDQVSEKEVYFDSNKVRNIFFAQGMVQSLFDQVSCYKQFS